MATRYVLASAPQLMSATWFALVVGAGVLSILCYAWGRRAGTLATAARLEELERVAQTRAVTLTRLSTELGGARGLNRLKRAIAAELPALTGTEDFWVVAGRNKWTVLAGGLSTSEIPHVVTGPPGTWERFPLVGAGGTEGWLGVRRPKSPFSEEQRQMLYAAATLIGVAVRNIRLFSRARNLTMIDTLTQCLTRRYGIDALSREMRRSSRSQRTLCVAMLDLDHFKDVNDTHGHLVGDRVLAVVARALRRSLRAADIACRYGGEEFLILFPETSLSGAERAAETVRLRIVATPLRVGSEWIPVSASIGVTEAKHGELDPLPVILRADLAMYEAKRAGRNRVIARPASQSEEPDVPLSAVGEVVPELSPDPFSDHYNRRSSPRSAAGLSVTYRVGDTVATAPSFNISQGGLGVRTTDPPDAGASVKVRWAFPGSTKDIDADASVAWTDRRVGMGLRFTGLDPADVAEIDHFLRSHLFSNFNNT